MKLRNKLSYIALGGLLMLIGMLASSMFMPNLFAQRDKFGEIECASLKIIGKDGSPKMWFTTGIAGGGSIMIFNTDTDEKRRDFMNIGFNEYGGVFAIRKDGKSVAVLSADKHGGRVDVRGRGKGKVIMAITDYGDGTVHTWDKNGNRQ